MISSIKDFLKLESSGGIILIISALFALFCANSPLAHWYHELLYLPGEWRLGDIWLKKPLLLWINDGLMAIFFFVIGLELKREFYEGELSDLRSITFPALGAIGGMVVPAAIYAAFNWSEPDTLKGWAIPAATDIAFALGILTLLRRVPAQLKVFLVSLAIFDDLGAILIIALYYTSSLSWQAIAVALFCLNGLLFLNRNRVTETAPYIIIGFVLWVALLKSGVHATLAGVILAFFIPLYGPKGQRSPLRDLEHNLHTAVAFGILPLFAFVNSGISLKNFDASSLKDPVTLGIILGLFFGKQIGVFGFCWIGVKLKLAQLPRNIRWREIYGVSILCGVGFTMSLFVASLAFQNSGTEFQFPSRAGIMIGSLLSGFCGYVFLSRVLGGPRRRLKRLRKLKLQENG